MSYLSGIYLESWFFWFGGGMQKALKNKRKQTEEKHSKKKRKKNEEYKESQITTINIFGFTFYIKKSYFAQKHSFKNLVHTIAFTVFMCCRV